MTDDKLIKELNVIFKADKRLPMATGLNVGCLWATQDGIEYCIRVSRSPAQIARDNA